MLESSILDRCRCVHLVLQIMDFSYILPCTYTQCLHLRDNAFAPNDDVRVFDFLEGTASRHWVNRKIRSSIHEHFLDPA